jgi:hypothetical protein
MSGDLRLCDVVWLVAEMHTSRAITAGQAVEILADIADLTLIMSARVLREFERQEHGEPADQWTDAVDTYYERRLRDIGDDWRRLERGDDGSWC